MFEADTHDEPGAAGGFAPPLSISTSKIYWVFSIILYCFILIMRVENIHRGQARTSQNDVIPAAHKNQPVVQLGAMGEKNNWMLY